MNRGKSRRGGGFGGAQGGYRGQRVRGLFADGIWHCDCDPRLPAEHFKVRKEGKNNGRWFYTCQKAEDLRCGFFLWDDEAKVREEGAVLQNSRTEPRSTAGAISNRHDGHQRVSTTPTAKPAAPLYYQTTSDESLQVDSHQMSNSDDFNEAIDNWTADSPALQRLENEAMIDFQQRYPPQTLNTPSKRNFSSMNEHGLITPQTGSRSTLFNAQQDSASSKRRATDADFLNIVSPVTTPSPMRLRDGDSGDTATNEDQLFDNIFNVLTSNNAQINPEIMRAVKSVCNRHSLRTQGVLKGREISRLAIKAKDAKLAELQLRIETLEAELETERAIVRHLRWEQENGQD